jgi:uncharacterized membrane-anchored protein
MWIINAISAVSLLLLGYLIKKFKMSYLIAGYNTSSKKEKEKYDEKKLTNYVGNLLIISSLFLIKGIILYFIIREENIIIVSWILFTIILIGGVIHLNITNYVKKK